MNKTVADAVDFANEVIGRIPSDEAVETLICPPALHLHPLRELLKSSRLKLGAQNMHWEDKGAYTGEISPAQLKDIGAEYVIIGHSERRGLFNESDENVNKKVRAAFEYGLTPIVCIGETFAEREAEETMTVTGRQVELALANVKEDHTKKAVIAYEPIWAIGTGKNASPEDANAVCAHIRSVIAERFSEEAAKMIRIQYGGSVNPENIASFMNKEHIDGALVGGASLESQSFIQLLEAIHHG